MAGQTGETTFIFSAVPVVDLANAPNVASEFSNGTLTLTYTLGLGGNQFVTISESSSSVVVIIMDKKTATQWHAPIIPGTGTFANYFSVGTNQRYSTHLASIGVVKYEY